MSNYLNWLWSKIGPDITTLAVYARACIVNQDGRLLWQCHPTLGQWELPGGPIELDEDLPHCLARTVLADTGLHIQPKRVIGVYSAPEYSFLADKRPIQPISISFECQVLDGRPIPGPNILDLKWFASWEMKVAPPLFRVMAADSEADTQSAIFLRGQPGQRVAQTPYYQQLRPHIGQAMYLMPAASAFVQNDAGHVLLHKRGDMNIWGLPGGGVEPGERLEQTMIDEVREETGFQVAPTRLLGVYSDDMYLLKYPHGDEAKVVSFLFEGRIVGGQLYADGEESLAVEFFPPNALPPLRPRDVRRIENALTGQVQAFF